jgi:hypothetical protein
MVKNKIHIFYMPIRNCSNTQNSPCACQQPDRYSNNKVYEPPSLLSNVAGIVSTRPAIYLQGFATECSVFLMGRFPLSVSVCPSDCEDFSCSLNGLFQNPAMPPSCSRSLHGHHE